MCLNTTKKEIKDFKEDHKDDEVVQVWKIYRIDGDEEQLLSPYGSFCRSMSKGSTLKCPGTIESSRESKQVPEPEKCFGSDYYTPRKDKPWSIGRGIHVFTTRRSAGRYRRVRRAWAEFKNSAIVCCQAKMTDYVAANDNDEAVFMKISISKRNFRKAIYQNVKNILDNHKKIPQKI